jgi:hypothetical protein
MGKKAQAAFEFLATYGWAFIVIAIAIAAIAYFGILSPERVLPNRCTFASEFTCLDYQISAASNEFRLKLKNGAGFPMTITSVTLASESATQYSCTAPANIPITNMPSGNTTDLTFTSCNTAAAGFTQGGKAKVLVTVNYYDSRSGSTYAKVGRGEVFSSVV